MTNPLDRYLANNPDERRGGAVVSDYRDKQRAEREYKRELLEGAEAWVTKACGQVVQP